MLSPKTKKELIEWIILLSIGGIIYLSGCAGKIQEAILSMGIFQPAKAAEGKYASYDFLLEDFEGNSINFGAFKGRVVFLNFWATWCPPCIAELPDIHRLYAGEGRMVDFVMISLDTNKDKARAFVTEKRYKFPTYFLRSALPESYNIHAIPSTYLLDKNGKIHIENHGMAKYNTEKFRKLLTSLAQQP